MPTPCFMLHPTRKQRIYLRRYHSATGNGTTCPGPRNSTYHNARALLGVHEGEATDIDQHVTEELKGDPLWPAKCDDCAYLFVPSDEWQVFIEHVFTTEQGTEYALRDAPPGAMWHAHWFDDARRSSRAPDGKNLIVRCPGGFEWWIDGPASNGPGWTRTGEPPQLTCTPSIQTPNYHGFLTNGVFSDA